MDKNARIAFGTEETVDSPMATKEWFFTQMELYYEERNRKDALQHEQSMKIMREMM